MQQRLVVSHRLKNPGTLSISRERPECRLSITPTLIPLVDTVLTQKAPRGLLVNPSGVPGSLGPHEFW